MSPPPCPYECGLTEAECLKAGKPIIVQRCYYSWEPVYQCRTNLKGLRWVEGRGWI